MIAVYNHSNILNWIRRVFRCQRDVGPRSFDAVAKRELEAALRDAGLSWRVAKIAISVFEVWSKSATLRDVEGTPANAVHRDDARADGELNPSPHKRQQH